MAPILGELVSGHQTLFQFVNPLSFVLTALPYGFGAIICRELTVRWGKGWFCLVLLGIAYGIYEEAIVARSIWDPNWAELGALADYSYWGGITWTWTEVLLHFHLTISIISSVVLVTVMYPEQRHERWASNRALAACFAGLALWAPILSWLHPFMPPIGGFILALATIAGLACVAWRLPAQVFPSRAGTGTRPLWYGVVAAVNMTVVFLSLFVLPEENLSWLPAWPVLFVLIAALDGITFWLVMRWSGNGTAWDDRHRLAMVIGMLAFFIPLLVLKDMDECFSGLTIVAILAVWGLWKLWDNTQAHYTNQNSTLSGLASTT
ncbi:MAG: hypothetical protein JW753_10105 [Dehalococcoidia bacterium]|nr:hypothetical protein [Dehalococcoidia bacterium]